MSGDNVLLDLENIEYVAMDWKTDGASSSDVVCLVKNKDVSMQILLQIKMSSTNTYAILDKL